MTSDRSDTTVAADRWNGRNVGSLPPRVAHAMHALIVASVEHNMPVTAGEIVIYDEEARNATATGAALREARAYGLAVYTGRYWVPTNRALDLRTGLEERYLRDQDALDQKQNPEEGR